jgi:hypothetical protein
MEGACGSVAEWLIAPVLKTGDGKPFVSSNLTASANLVYRTLKNNAILETCFFDPTINPTGKGGFPCAACQFVVLL